MTVFTTHATKMDNVVESPDVVKDKRGGRMVLLVGAVVVLALCIVVLVGFGGWFMHGVNTSNNDSTKEHFELSVTFDKTVYPEHVQVDVEGKSEFTIIRDPDTFEISSIMFIDFQNRVEVVYRSEADMCTLNQLSDDFLSFSEELALLTRQNGTVVDEPSRAYYDVEDLISDESLIPSEMKAYCTLMNSYWAVEIDEGDRVKRDDRECKCCTCCGCRCHCCCCSCCSGGGSCGGGGGGGDGPAFPSPGDQ